MPTPYPIIQQSRLRAGGRISELLESFLRSSRYRIEMEQLATTVLQHDEHEQHPHGDRRNREEIDRHQLAEVVVKNVFHL